MFVSAVGTAMVALYCGGGGVMVVVMVGDVAAVIRCGCVGGGGCSGGKVCGDWVLAVRRGRCNI